MSAPDHRMYMELHDLVSDRYPGWGARLYYCSTTGEQAGAGRRRRRRRKREREKEKEKEKEKGSGETRHEKRASNSGRKKLNGKQIHLVGWEDFGVRSLSFLGGSTLRRVQWRMKSTIRYVQSGAAILFKTRRGVVDLYSFYREAG